MTRVPEAVRRLFRVSHNRATNFEPQPAVPNELTASINHERMPVLLTDPADFETWLSGSTEEALKLARSYAADQMRIVQSGSERKDLLQAA